MIKVENVCKQYGTNKALDHINFEVNKGEIVGLLGRNGAGKSTLMNIITGNLTATSGTVRIGDYDILEDDKDAKKLLGYLPELPPLYPTMTVEEYLEFVFDLKNIKKDKKQHIDEVAKQTGIDSVLERVIKNLSKGYRQRVGMAQAILGSPELLILDEPTVGLDPQQIVEIRDLVRGMSRKHTVIISSHILAEVQNICSRIIVIHKGKLVADGTPEELVYRYLKSHKLEIRAVGREGDVFRAISQIDGVKRVVNLGQKEPDSYDFRIEYDKNEDIRKKVFIKMADSGIPLLSMKEYELQLEDIFLEITE